MDYKEMVDTGPIAQVVDNIGAKSVFGEPMSENGVLIIPVAQVEYAFGYGGGYGTTSKSDDGEDIEGDVPATAEESAEESAEEGAEESTPSEGGGGGGGAGGRATPRGYIRITPEEVTYEPISDDERVPLAGILMVAWSVFWITLTIRALGRSVARVLKQA